MRSVPHRVVCLVGLDDGVFPRSTVTDGDDVLAARPADRRARRRGARTASCCSTRCSPPARRWSSPTPAPTSTAARRVPRPCRSASCSTPSSAPRPGARAQVLVRHPLQPFDDQNFVPGALGSTSAFCFDEPPAPVRSRVTAGAHPGPAARRGPAARASASRTSSLADLRSFLVHPVRGFLRRRLDVGVPREYDEVDDALPGRARRPRGVADRRPGAARRHRRSGPAGHPARRAAARRPATAPARRAAAPDDHRARREALRRDRRASAPSSPGRSTSPSTSAAVAGSPASCPTCAATASCGSTTARCRRGTGCEAWVDLLALSASDPDRSWTARTVGWYRRGPADVAAQGPVDHRAPRPPARARRRHATAACASRCRCRSRPASPGPRPSAPHSDPDWKATRRLGVLATAARSRASRTTPRTCGCSAGTRRSTCLTGPPATDERWNDRAHPARRSTPCASGSRSSPTSGW